MTISDLCNKKLGLLPLKDWVLLILFYSFFGFAYSTTIYLTSEGKDSFLPNVIVDYCLKAAFTLPIWWLIFRRLSHWSLLKKCLLHLIMLPIFVLGWQQTYYGIIESMGEWHMDWPFAWWDIYIPGLFYVLQFGIFHVYDFYHKLKKQHTLELELREAAVQSELTALKAQLNPHFLYNTFNTISASVPPGQERTRELIAKLADMFRYQLQGSKVDLIPLNEEIEFLKIYLELEKARFGDRLKFNFEIAPEISDAKIPPMLLQPLVENAVKHGISPKIEGGMITLCIFPKGDHIHFEIKDSGIGFNGHAQILENGVGLTNTRKRLKKMYEADLNIKELDEGGVVVSFEIPGNDAMARG